jgi:hypothetical protein
MLTCFAGVGTLTETGAMGEQWSERTLIVCGKAEKRKFLGIFR